MKKLLVVLLVLGLAAPAMATDFYMYGSIRTHLGYYDASEEYSGGPAMDPTIAGGAASDSDSGTLLSLGGQSRFGAKYVASDKLSGVVEFGFRETIRPNAAGNDPAGGQIEEPYLRMLLGIWNFGAGKLTVGKGYTPATFLGYSSMHGDLGDQGDANMLVAGLTYIGRQPLIQLTFGGFEFALIEPNTSASSLGLGDVDFTLPRIEAAYVFRTPVVAIRPILGFQTYDAESATASESVDSFVAGLGVSLTLGPAYIKMTGSYQQNGANYGQSSVIGVASRGAALNSTGGIEDATSLMGTFVVGMAINPSFGIEAGVGYTNSEVDAITITGLGTLDRTAEQTGMVYYFQAPITVAKGVQIIPEIGFLDRGDLEVDGLPDTDLGDLTYFDVNFRIDF